MLKTISLENFTSFQQAEFNFASGINIIIGENSSGKSHILKVAYSAASVWEQCGKEGWKGLLKNKLHRVFGITELFELRNRATLLTAEHYRVTVDFLVNHKNIESQQLSFDLNGRDSISINGSVPHAPIRNKPLFIPAKEVLSIFPNFISLYEKYALSFDETYYDLCKAIDNPLLKEPNQQLLDKIELLTCGKIILKGNQFYLQTERGDIGIFMVAEGWRKLGMLSYLIANDSLKENSILFWDEPETNLNPRLMKQLATFLVELSQHNVQIIIATHNLFLMKYFDYLIAQSQGTVSSAFFSLVRQDDKVYIEQGQRLKQLKTILALEEELQLYDKEQAAFYSQW
ncbi:MAG: AAA family ATPase [Methylococcaceae bacterium]